MRHASSCELHLSFPFCQCQTVSAITILMLRSTRCAAKLAILYFLQSCTRGQSFEASQPSSHGTASSSRMLLSSSEDHDMLSDHRELSAKTISLHLKKMSLFFAPLALMIWLMATRPSKCKSFNACIYNAYITGDVNMQKRIMYKNSVGINHFKVFQSTDF